MEENISQNPQIEPVVEIPVQTPKPWLKIGPLVFLGLIVVVGAAYAGMQIGKKQASIFYGLTPMPTEVIIPTITPSPTEEVLPTIPVSTPTPDLTVGWKTYTNDFAKFTLRYPDTFSFTEKSFSDKEKQVVFKGSEGSLIINMATSDYSPGWGGGCGEKDKKLIIFLGKQVQVCLNETGMHELYAHHPSGEWDLNLSFSLLSPKIEDQEVFLKVLSTFNFLE